MDAGHVKSVYGRDPEGNVIEIQQTADHCDFRLDKLPEILHRMPRSRHLPSLPTVPAK